MDISQVLRDILVVLVAAKVAAELAERAGIPAVVGEIVAGILIGPSMLGAVGHGDEVLRTLGEIGVILLLLDVGLEMDLGELGKVGRASLLVATVGVVTPMLLGFGAMELIGSDFKTSLFIGAALTATSVGITARVFGDLRALSTTEARIVLGAAVADDVMGLVVLTVVVRLVTEGSVSLVSVAGIVLIAVGFLTIGGLVGLRAAPPLFAMVERVSRSTGTMVAIALAFTLGFAELANAAKLAPIVGAFVAGIALSRSEQSDRVRRELAPVGHLFIPVFFLQIGIDADVSVFTRSSVLRDAALLLVAAVIGKLISPLGAIGSPGDKQLIGLGMLPRGEVGLIFATIGLQNGVLDQDLYASLLVVVLVTTLVTPQLLKARYTRLRRNLASTAATAGVPVLALALDAAIGAARARPDDELLDLLAAQPEGELRWSTETRDKLLDVIERGNARSWRFLSSTGVLARALPELDAAMAERDRDAFGIDPLQSYRLRAAEKLRALDNDDPLADEIRALPNVDDLLLAALLGEGLEHVRDPVSDSRRILRRLGVDPRCEAAVLAAVRDRDLLFSAARQPGALGEHSVLQLASHLGDADSARLLYSLSALRDEGRERWELSRLRQLHDLVQAVLADPQLSGPQARSVDELHRRDAIGMLAEPEGAARRRVLDAPRGYVLAQSHETLLRHARFIDPLPQGRGARVQVSGEWLDIVARDRLGLFAVVTGALAGAGIEVRDAVVATWDDGAALESFRVENPPALEEGELAALIGSGSASPSVTLPLPDATVEMDNTASPWHTVCEVRAVDRPGLLHALAEAFAAARVDVHAVSAGVEHGMVIDRFELTDRRGSKLTKSDEAAIRRNVREGVRSSRRRGRISLFR